MSQIKQWGHLAKNINKQGTHLHKNTTNKVYFQNIFHIDVYTKMLHDREKVNTDILEGNCEDIVVLYGEFVARTFA